MKYLFLALFMVGCSSAVKTSNQVVIEPDQVLSRIDGLKERPSWLKESEPFTVADGSVVSLGEVSIPADHRVEAAYRIAESNAKGQIAKAIEQRLDYIFQNAEEGTAMDSTQARSISAEAAKMTTSSIRTDKRYWEKVMTTDEHGQKKMLTKVYATVKMPENDFKRSVLDAIRKQQGKGGLSADFGKKVDQHWDTFVQGAPVKEVPQ